MRHARRYNLTPRIEIMPLIDVIFLLLTFFIYSLVTMVRAEILPVELQTITTGRAAEPTAILAITIDQQGGLYLNRDPVSEETLDARLSEVAALDDPPTLFLALEDVMPSGSGGAVTDRGPMLVGLIERVRQAGLADFNIVGERAAE